MNRLAIIGLIVLVTGLARGDEGWVMCEECVGAGNIEIDITCEVCEGYGFLWELCPTCGGTEVTDIACFVCGGDGTVDCGWCGGDGWIKVMAEDGVTEIDQLCPACNFGQLDCDVCEGSGILQDEPCPICTGGEIKVDCTNCGGYGVVTITETCEACHGEGGYWEEE